MCKDKTEQKLYLFPYLLDDNLKNYDFGSKWGVNENEMQHISYYYHYRGDSGGPKLDNILDLFFEVQIR